VTAIEVIVITDLRWWHIDEVLRIEADLFGAEQWSAAMFWNELASGHHYVAAFADDQLVGYAGVALSPPAEAWINNIAVCREQQRHGIARMLMDHMLSYARRHDVRAILLEVAADNAPAQRLYASYGFDVVGVRRGYYQPSNTDALVMRRQER
jgi:ribosomal-protein-alanine N-acetyltransferase